MNAGQRLHGTNLQLPSQQQQRNEAFEDDYMITPRAANNSQQTNSASGPSVGAAPASNSTQGAQAQNHVPAGIEDGSPLEKRPTNQSQSRNSTERPVDPRSNSGNMAGASENTAKLNGTSGEDASSNLPADAEKEEKTKEGTSLFGKGKKLRMNFPKKFGRTSTDVKAPALDERSETSEKSEEKEDKIIQDNFFGVIQKMRYDYEERLQHDSSQSLVSDMTPSSPNETPILKPSIYTTVIIQEEQPDTGRVADLYRGTVGSLGKDADIIERVAPTWLGELLLRVGGILGKMIQSC